MKWILPSLIILLSYTVSAQPLPPASIKVLKQKEDSIKGFATKLIMASTAEERFTADSLFTKGFVRALQVNNSFAYPFDSLLPIAKVYPTDSSFRIFTWGLVINENLTRQHGAIQMKTADGSLKLFPLIDKSDLIKNHRDTIADNFNWIGAVYYKLIQTSYKNKKYYTLLGFDENNIRTDKKIIEVMTFEGGKPIFGGNFFVLEKTSGLPNTPGRYIMEYKKETSPKLNFDKDLNMIVMEHLVSQTGEPNKKFTLVPDGDYEGFKWINGKWAYISKIFNEVTPLGKSPVPNPIRDDKGNIDPTKLKGGEN